MKKNLIPLTLGGLGIGTTEFVMMGLLPDIAKDFNVSIPVAGHLISAYALGVVIGAPLLVAISSSYPPKKILIALMVMFTAFNAFSAFAPDDNALFIARLLSGLPHGAFFGVGSVVASRLAEKGKQAQAISVMFAGLTIANLLSVPLGTYIGHHYSWRYTFALIAFIGLMALLFIQLWLPALPVSRQGDIKSEMGFFKTREAWLILLTTAIGTGGLFCWISYIAPLMTDVGHFSKNSVPLILIVAGLGMVIGNILGGKLADWVAPVKACLILLISMAVALVTIYFVSGNQVLSIIMTFITGALSMAIGSPIQILMIRTAKGAEMLGAAATQAAFNTGNALGALLGGLPIAVGYGFTSPELVGVAMAITGALFAVALLKRQAVKRELQVA
ncbi:MFS transporter [Mucilaginibacter flavus]|uniref:MFS transporter n=1 Tax=Mucilaginibacter flavus TaxID=931504 RepID=UPI0025B58212|nr:MFS transporter [Mucilaginibacter flavus]MDN3582166.1 MFS transporter [Mucilaginibacter flavus]